MDLDQTAPYDYNGMSSSVTKCTLWGVPEDASLILGYIHRAPEKNNHSGAWSQALDWLILSVAVWIAKDLRGIFR